MLVKRVINVRVNFICPVNYNTLNGFKEDLQSAFTTSQGSCPLGPSLTLGDLPIGSLYLEDFVEIPKDSYYYPGNLDMAFDQLCRYLTENPDYVVVIDEKDDFAIKLVTLFMEREEGEKFRNNFLVLHLEPQIVSAKEWIREREE